MRIRLQVLLVAACGLTAPALSVAQSLVLDPAFGNAGIVIEAHAVANVSLLQPDGRVLVGGVDLDTYPLLYLRRFLPNGEPDPDFTTPTLPLHEVRDIALQQDGRIVLAGHTDFSVFTVARLLEDGSPDPGFGGGDGVVTTTFLGQDLALAIAIQPDDKIVVTGYTLDVSARALVARYLPDGSPDPAFGTGGAVLGPEAERPLGNMEVLLDSLGRILMPGGRQLIRFLPGGTLDPSFGVMGVFGLTPGYDTTSIAAAPDGSTIVLSNGSISDEIQLERYTSDWMLDPSFGEGGRVRFGSPFLVGADAMAVLADGRFYVTGYQEAAFFLGRFLEDGSFDATFGIDGFLLTAIRDSAFAKDLAVPSDGAVILAGTSTDQLADTRVTMARYAACPVSTQPPPTITSVQPAEVSSFDVLVQVTGTGIDPAAEIRVGSTLGRVVGSPGPGTIEVDAGVHPIGYIDLVVRNPDCQTATMSDAVFVYPFDVPPADTYYPFVKRLIVNGVTGGCSFLGYCPDNPVTRAQMSVFLLRSKEGAAYEPPPATGTVFADVPIEGFAAAWIEELSRRGITAGCDVNLYCPDSFNTRAQMAVFLLVTLEGTGYQPPPATGVFSDVPASSIYAPWVEEIFDRGITGGCGVNIYCPDDAVLREQMAVFLSVTFNLPG